MNKFQGGVCKRIYTHTIKTYAYTIYAFMKKNTLKDARNNHTLLKAVYENNDIFVRIKSHINQCLNAQLKQWNIYALIKNALVRLENYIET